MHPPATVLLRRFLQRLIHVGTSRQPRRSDGEKNTGTPRHKTGDSQDPPIQADDVEPWKLAQVELLQGIDAAPGNEDSQGRGDAREGQALDQELAGEAQAPGTNGHANAELAPT